MSAKALRIAGKVLVALILLGLVAALATAFVVRGSLPRLDGEVRLTGLAAAGSLKRDGLGMVDIEAESREDAARILGYAHAQDRFFQMDLQRRVAAGELAALFGEVALETDRENRRHQFRLRAREVLAGLRPADRAVLEAYTGGVNAGLADLRARPFEYLLLRQSPQAWMPEDTVLTLHAMFLDLSYSVATTELQWSIAAAELPADVADFLLARSSRWEAPLEPGGPPLPTLPDSTVVDLRGSTGRPGPVELTDPPHDSAGSNNWALAGAHTGDGRALLANDMHLGLQVPNIWYRARMTWTEEGRRRTVVGVTLPGAPALVVGSNGAVAWGFTNSYGDWADLVRLETGPDGYRTPDGWRRLERQEEILDVAGGEPDTLQVERTIWGPVWAEDADGRPLVLRWTAHDAEAVNFRLLDLERAGDVGEAISLAAETGIPPQNFVCADSGGRIGWTIAGRIPRRFGHDGRLLQSWADGARGWDGYLEAAAQPRLVDPPEGRLWTANNRSSQGWDLSLIGDGGYALGARARQIRDALRAGGPADETSMLALQLDDRALFLGEWRERFLESLAPLELEPRRRALVECLRDDWDGRASVESVSYRVVRRMVREFVEAAYSPWTRTCRDADPRFDPGWLPHTRQIAWQLLEDRPAHLIPPPYASWDEVVLACLDSVATAVDAEGGQLADFTWGRRNTVSVRHPFARLLPALSRWLASNPRPLPGDTRMPRVQGLVHGASERMVVAPGHEEDALFHMPGGQSGHPLSPYFLAGHEDWETGRAVPLLPGPPEHELRLVPGSPAALQTAP